MVEAETILFASLFAGQTALYLFLLRRSLTSRSVTGNSHEVQERLRHVEGTLGRLQSENGDEASALSDGELADSALEALRLLQERGSMTSSDISRALGRSREHTSRILKTLYLRGVVSRFGKPYRYGLTDRGASVLGSQRGAVKPADS